MATMTYAHITFREDGQPIIAEANFKIKHLVQEHIAYGWDADELQHQHPYLTLAQIHSALAYYHDHKEEMDKDLEERFRYAENLRAQQDDSPQRQKLQDAKRQLT